MRHLYWTIVMQIFFSKEIRLVISLGFHTTISFQEKRPCLSGKEILLFTHCLSACFLGLSGQPDLKSRLGIYKWVCI